MKLVTDSNFYSRNKVSHHSFWDDNNSQLLRKKKPAITRRFAVHEVSLTPKLLRNNEKRLIVQRAKYMLFMELRQIKTYFIYFWGSVWKNEDRALFLFRKRGIFEVGYWVCPGLSTRSSLLPAIDE